MVLNVQLKCIYTAYVINRESNDNNHSKSMQSKFENSKHPSMLCLKGNADVPFHYLIYFKNYRKKNYSELSFIGNYFSDVGLLC